MSFAGWLVSRISGGPLYEEEDAVKRGVLRKLTNAEVLAVLQREGARFDPAEVPVLGFVYDSPVRARTYASKNRDQGYAVVGPTLLNGETVSLVVIS